MSLHKYISMSKIFVITITFMVLLLSCKKHVKDAQYKTTETPSLIGNWIWENSTGGISGNDTIIPPANSIVFISFKSDMTFTLKEDEQIISQGTYQVDGLELII
jgi:hypothetical protein